MDALTNVSTLDSYLPAKRQNWRVFTKSSTSSPTYCMASAMIYGPIRTITCYTTLLQQQDGIGANQQTLEYLHFASGAAQRLQALTAGILEWAEMLKL